MAELVVVLVRTRNPLNIGAAARAMSNFGVSRLRVVKPYEAAFREARSAVGAAAVMMDAKEFSSVAEAIADCSLVIGTTAAQYPMSENPDIEHPHASRFMPQAHGSDRELHHPLYRLEHAVELVRHHPGQRIALLFGSEKTGLSTEEMSHCHWLLRIPTREEHVSMNLGQAVAVCLYEMARKTIAAPAISQILAATDIQLERLTKLLLQALTASGYIAKGSEQATELKVRRLVHRLQLEHSDADVVTGMLRKIVWRLERPGTDLP